MKPADGVPLTGASSGDICDSEGLVRLCSVSQEAAVKMASLVREFHPCRFGGTAAPETSGEGELHTAWISGLIAAGIEQARPGCVIRRLTIEYYREVSRDDPLSVETAVEEGVLGSEHHFVTFSVFSADVSAAEGSALVEDCSRED